MAHPLSRIALLSVCFWSLFTFAIVPTGFELELIPKERPFRLTFADPREIRMALSSQGASSIQASVGNYFSIFSIRDPEDLDWTFHFGLEGAGFFSLRQADRRFPLETTDGLLGIYAEGGRSLWQYQVRYTHISAHLSDGSSEHPIAYSREFLTVRGGILPLPQLHFYVGTKYLVRTIPELPRWGLQLGGSYFLGLGKFSPFVATDLKWQQESPVNPSLNLQIGLALNNPPQAYRSFRFFYNYYTGADYRGQYFMRELTTHSFGIEMQI